MRRVASVLLLLTASAAALSGCGSDRASTDSSDSTPSSSTSRTTSSSSAAACQGGAVRLLQGIPTDLSGGARAGFTGLASPTSVRLMVSGTAAGEQAPGELHEGDTFAVAGTTYRVSCLSPSVVTLDPAS